MQYYAIIYSKILYIQYQNFYLQYMPCYHNHSKCLIYTPAIKKFTKTKVVYMQSRSQSYLLDGHPLSPPTASTDNPQLHPFCITLVVNFSIQFIKNSDPSSNRLYLPLFNLLFPVFRLSIPALPTN